MNLKLFIMLRIKRISNQQLEEIKQIIDLEIERRKVADEIENAGVVE